jgi:preprotein translocase subunit Sss1
MDKFKITLIILFIIGVVGALNSISDQSTIEQEKGFIKSMLNILGFAYKPEAEEAREFDYIPAKTQSELSRIAAESQKSTPSASPGQNTQQINGSPFPSPALQYLTPSPKPSTSPSPNPYGFGFSN